MTIYIRRKNSSTWHTCHDCSKYPTESKVVVTATKPQEIHVCRECKAKPKDDYYHPIDYGSCQQGGLSPSPTIISGRTSWEIVVDRSNTSHAYNEQLRADIVGGKELHSRLVTFAKYHAEPEWDILWLWQLWQESVTAHLKCDEDHQTFVRLKCRLSGRGGSLAYLGGCFGHQLEYLENLLKSSDPRVASGSRENYSSRSRLVCLLRH